MYADHLTKQSYRALMFDELEDYEEAIQDLSRFIDSHPTNSAAFNNRGVARWEIGQIENALGDFENAVLVNPNDPIPHVNKGDVLKRLNEYQKAIESYTQAIEIEGNISFYICRAYTYVEMDLPQKAIEDFDVALGLDPKHKQTYIARGKAYEAIGDKTRATQDFERARK